MSCPYCGCTPDSPCRFGGGDECAVLDPVLGVCNALSCQHRWAADRKRFARERKARVREMVTPIARRVIQARRDQTERRKRAAARKRRKAA